MTDQERIQQLEELVVYCNEWVLAAEGVNIWYWTPEEDNQTKMLREICTKHEKSI